MLFKYIGRDPIDFFTAGEVRFTPPSELNDFFDVHPSAALASREEIAALPLAPDQDDETGPRKRVMTGEFLRNIVKMAARGVANQAHAVQPSEHAVLLDNTALARHAIGQDVGVFSVTEVPDSQLMWSHYANEHRGYVICLDSKHTFFSDPKFSEPKYHIRRVRYSDMRPAVTAATLDRLEPIFTKSSEWSCEREWRLVRPLSAAQRIKMNGNSQIHFFRFHRTP